MKLFQELPCTMWKTINIIVLYQFQETLLNLNLIYYWKNVKPNYSI